MAAQHPPDPAGARVSRQAASPDDALVEAIAALLRAQALPASPAEIRAAARTWQRLAPPQHGSS